MSIDDPIEIDADGTRLRLAGRIDRLEWSRRSPGLRVIDYKIGRAPWAEGRRRRTAAARCSCRCTCSPPPHLLEREPEQGVGAVLLRDAPRRLRAPVVQRRGARRGRRGRRIGLLRSLLEGIRGGDFHAEPRTTAAYCAFDRLCDSSRVALRERKAADPLAIAVADRLARTTHERRLHADRRRRCARRSAPRSTRR